MKTAIVTGVLGQDGSYLADYLLSLGYSVYGVYRRVSTENNFNNISDAKKNRRFSLVCGDITDHAFVAGLIIKIKPDEFYSLAAMSHVGQSFSEPLATFSVNALAVINMLESIKNASSNTRFYQASTSEIWGGLTCPKEGYTEESLFHPRSPYGVAKLAAFWAVKNYREAYGTYAVNGILHNHESPRRALDFAPRKITHGIASIVKNRRKKLVMGNVDAFRDIGHAKDYVRAMHLMLQQDKPEDFLVATGDGATIREMIEYVSSLAGLTFDDVYEKNLKFMRPSEVPFLKGNPKKIKGIGWNTTYTWKTLLREMYENDLKLLEDEDEENN